MQIIHSIRVVYLIAALLFSFIQAGGQIVLKPTLPQNEPAMTYRDKTVLIRFAIKDVVEELTSVTKSEWYLTLDSAQKNKIESLLKSIDGKANYLDVTAPVYNQFFARMIQEFIGATLLAKERALIWNRNPLVLINKIHCENEGNKSFFYLRKKGEPFFSGIIMKNPPANADLLNLDFAPTKNDSLLNSIQESVIKNSEGNPKYPGGNGALLDFINQNFSCKGPTGVTTTVAVTIDSVGFIEKSSIKFNGSFPEKCKKDFIEVLLRSKQWQPAYSIIGNRNVSSGVLITLTF